MVRIVIVCSALERIAAYASDLAGAIEKTGRHAVLIKDDQVITSGKKEEAVSEIRNTDYLISIMSREESVFVFQAAICHDGGAKVISLIEDGAKDDSGGLGDGVERIRFNLDGFPDTIKRVIDVIKKDIARKSSGYLGPTPGGYMKKPPARENSLMDPRLGPISTIPAPAIAVCIMGSPQMPGGYLNIGRYAKMAADDIAPTLQYGTTWEISQIRVQVDGNARWITAIADTQTKFILACLATHELPDDELAAQIFQVAQHVTGTPTMINSIVPFVHGKSFKKTLDDKPGFAEVRFSRDGTGSGWLDEYLEAVLQKVMARHSNLENDAGKLSVEYEVISHNFLRRPYAADVPANLAGFHEEFDDIFDIFRYAEKSDKYFMMMLGDMTDIVSIKKRLKEGRVMISIKDWASSSTRNRIESGLLACRFTRTEGTFQHAFSFGPGRHVSNKGPYPYKMFDVCDNCGSVAHSTQEVILMSGFRNNDGNIMTQPYCRICRRNHKAKPPNLDSFFGRKDKASTGRDTRGGRRRRRRSTGGPRGADLGRFTRSSGRRRGTASGAKSTGRTKDGLRQTRITVADT